MKTGITILCSLMFISSLGAQTFTMGKKCRASLEVAEEALSKKEYANANDLYLAFAKKCKTRDAKEAASVGIAEALNGLGKYQEAIDATVEALKISKNKSLKAHFQRGVAYAKLGDVASSKNELDQVIRLTENNKNKQERAKNYALMSAIYERQISNLDSAQVYLDKAKELDPNNVNFVIQEGSMYSTSGDFTKAFASYDKASKMDPNNKELATARVNTRLRMMDRKYGTTKAQDLRGKMTSEETQVLCKDLQKLFSLGVKDMNKEMFKALVCN